MSDDLPIKCMKSGCTERAKYTGTTPDNKKIAVCYKHTFEFPPAMVKSK